MVSTPSRRQSRAMRRTSSAPSTGTPKLSWCRCSRRPSPSPPVTVSSGLAASSRGPSVRPPSMASRTATSSLIFAAAAEQALVKPAPSSRRAASMVRSAWSSGGSSPSAVPRGVSTNDRCAWPSTMPGIRNLPAASIRSAPSACTGSACGATTAMRSPSTRTLPGNGAAPVPSHTLAPSIRMRIVPSRSACRILDGKIPSAQPAASAAAPRVTAVR